MSSKSMVLLIAAVSLLLCAQLGMSANEERLASGTEVVVVLPQGTPLIYEEHVVLVFDGSWQGPTANVGNCLPNGGTFGQLHHVIMVSPKTSGGSGPLGNIVVTRVNGAGDPAPIPPGTRIGSLVTLGTCGSSGEFTFVRGFVE